jgi:hypothetical protein
MTLNNGQEVRIALKSRPPDNKWGLYGSVYCEEAKTYRKRRLILPKDFVKGLFYMEAGCGMDGWMGATRFQIDEVIGDEAKISVYSLGNKSRGKKDKIIQVAWPHEFIADEQSDEVLYELYKKGVFVKGYAHKEVSYFTEKMKEQDKITTDKYRPQVEQAIKDGKAKIEFEICEVREGIEYYRAKCYVDGLHVPPAFGFTRKDSMYESYWDECVMLLARELGFVPKNERGYFVE